MVEPSPYGQEEGWYLDIVVTIVNLTISQFGLPDRYPLPNSADFSAGISGSKFFTKLNIQKGYYQVPIAPDDIKKTGIITPFGMF